VFKVNHGLPVYAHACAGQSLSVAHAGLKSSGSSHDVKGLSVCVCVCVFVSVRKSEEMSKLGIVCVVLCREH